MSKKEKILSLLSQGKKVSEVAKATKSTTKYVYFVRWTDQKKQSKIVEAVEKTNKEVGKLFSQAYKKYQADLVNHPPHYTAGGIDFIDFAEAKGLTENAYLFNVVKYVVRAGKKVDVDPVQDLEKAEFYLKREIARRKQA
jgi:flagellar motor switch protein FliM